MGLKIKAKQTLMHVGAKAGKLLFVMLPETYSQLEQEKVVEEASVRSGIPKGGMSASWNAIGEVIKAWVTEGHSVAIPGLGTMRFGVQAKAVENIDDVKSELIRCRKVIFTPTVEIKQALKNTSIAITCYDNDGNVIKDVEAEVAAADAA